jgi:hypothetical protein
LFLLQDLFITRASAAQFHWRNVTHDNRASPTPYTYNMLALFNLLRKRQGNEEEDDHSMSVVVRAQ